MKYLFECDQPNCYRRLTFDTPEQVEHERTNHKCPYWGGDSKVAWSVTKTLVQQMWDMLDAEMDIIKGHWRADGPWIGPTQINPEYHQHRARAIAECIAIFMKPFFETSDDIVRESVRRWEARRDSDTEYETAGIGARRYESAAMAHESAAPGWYGTPEDGYTSNPDRAGAASTRRANRGQSAPAPIKIRLSEQDQTAIKKAHAAMPQIFTVKTLANQYGATEAEVAAILKS